MDLEQQLHAALAPREPGPGPLSAVMAQLSAAPALGRRRNVSRTILFGTVLAGAAAASMLALQLKSRPAPQADAATALVSPARSASLQEAAPVAATAATPAATLQAGEEKVEPENLLATARPFTVRVLPLQNQSTNSAARRAVDAFHAALLDGLRAVPGLVLVTDESTGFAPDAPVDFRLTLRGSEMPGDKFVVMLRAESVARRLILPIELSGEAAPACAGTGSSGCGDAASMAGLGLQLLRKNIFPADPVAPQQLRARILDTSLSASDRLAALQDLSLQTVIDNTGREAAARTSSIDAEVARSLGELGTAAADPGVRAQVWRSVRNLRVADLIPAMANALRTDREDSVRVEAAATLANDFAANPQVRAALEVAAQEDTRPMVRALARRGLLGESEWHDYVVSTLKDTSLTPAERIEPLFHAVNQRGKVPDLSRMLDEDAAIEAFADAFSRLQASAKGPELPTTVLMSGLGSIYHPAITGLLLDNLDRATQPSVRQSIVSQLIRRNADERVQNAFRKLSAEDADPEVRAMVTKALKYPVEKTAP
jgi:hypothetical protein